MNENEPLESEAIARLRRLGGDAFVQKMIDIYLDFVPAKIAAARAGMLSGDLKAVADAVHPLKSSSGGIGAGLLFDLTARIEKLAMKKQSATLPELMDELDAAFAQVRSRLEAVRQIVKP